MKKIGILGGMGPQASLDFYKILIEKTSIQKTDIKNSDYPSIILANIPVPDLINSDTDIEIAVNIVHREAQNLEKSGVDFLVMPCNTMHLFKDDIMKGVGIPFISMIECVTEKIDAYGFKKIGLLGSSTTMQSKLYLSPLMNMGVEVIIPEKNKHDNISQVILNYIAGNSKHEDIILLEKCCNKMIDCGAEAIILGCTELPLILEKSRLKNIFIASSEILAERTLGYSQT